MPLLKRKRLPPIQPPEYDSARKESRELTVWYSRLSQEIFQDYSYGFVSTDSLIYRIRVINNILIHFIYFYSEYLKRVSLYKKPIWQCESTGKSNLTFTEALESERTEKERVQDKLPGQLQKRVLLRVQFRKCCFCYI
jgi:hypothetical protein